MRRLPALAFAALVAATIGAFFITQHLKVSDPLIAGFRLVPGAINPKHGRVCTLRGKQVNFRRSQISFYLPDHSDTTGVFIVNASGEVVRKYAWRNIKRGHRAFYYWRGRELNGSQAPPGSYYVKVVLQHEGRAFVINSHPLRVITRPPRPKVVRVAVIRPAAGSDTTTSPSASSDAAGSSLTTGAAGATVITPPHGRVAIHFRPGRYNRASIVVYRSGAGGQLERVTSFAAGRHGNATWNGMIDGQPAPPGVYMIGVEMTDAACNLGSFPTSMHPTGSSASTGVTVSYLSVEPQLYPVAAGTEATVYVDAHGAPYTWALRRPGTSRPLSHGTESANSSGALHVPVPAGAAGLDVLTVRSSGRRISVPIVVSSAHGARMLVVLPALTWQGTNPVDDNGDGVPDVLSSPNTSIDLNRPLVNGLPIGLNSELKLLRYLDQQGLHYQLTTDVALAEGTGPSLGGHPGVILDGSFSWIPTNVAAKLRSYVNRGGRVLSLGERSLQSYAPVKPGTPQSATGPTAGPATRRAADPFGARHGTIRTLGNAILTTFADPLGIFGTAGAFSGYSSYQPVTPPTGTNVSLAGVAASVPAIAGFKLGNGTVVEVGLSGFGANLHRDEASRQLLTRVWKLFTG